MCFSSQNSKLNSKHRPRYQQLIAAESAQRRPIALTMMATTSGPKPLPTSSVRVTSQLHESLNTTGGMRSTDLTTSSMPSHKGEDSTTRGGTIHVPQDAEACVPLGTRSKRWRWQNTFASRGIFLTNDASYFVLSIYTHLLSPLSNLQYNCARPRFFRIF